MKRPLTATAGILAVALTLTACGGSDSAADADGVVDLTLGTWALSNAPEFQLLVDEFNASHDDVEVSIREYDTDNYETQMTADLAAGAAPDLYAQKTVSAFVTYQAGGQLVDVSDVADGLDEHTTGLGSWQVDGSTWAVPFRQDSWFLFYNKDLFEKAGVDAPDGTWTWDDYADAAQELSDATDADGAYQHVWQAAVQGFANNQTPGADLLSGDYGYLKPYYERALAMQDSGAQTDYGTATTNSLTYQAQFGKQKAAMMPMGSWYVAMLLSQQADGDADDFAWGIAPVPQYDESTTDEPVTFGDPTSVGVNAAIDDGKLDAAKEFLAFIAGEDAAVALASTGITPAYQSDAVTEAYFSAKGAPEDDLSRQAFQVHDTRPENPVDPKIAAVQTILGDLHSAVMSGSTPVDDAIAEAEQRAANEAGITG
ncbi:ABC transporter substrate-binding protein [Isoptericola sp. NPDC056578]|uniref:ABC transporter substrate-binding protein n=1 Tax=Isoptericola sp. NPDC056578 TaxID=3345870 RepID=UPI003688F9E6